MVTCSFGITNGYFISPLALSFLEFPRTFNGELSVGEFLCARNKIITPFPPSVYEGNARRFEISSSRGEMASRASSSRADEDYKTFGRIVSRGAPRMSPDRRATARGCGKNAGRTILRPFLGMKHPGKKNGRSRLMGTRCFDSVCQLSLTPGYTIYCHLARVSPSSFASSSL